MQLDPGTRITVRQKGELVPIVGGVVRRSPELAQRGLLLEHHAIEKSDFPKREAQSHIVYMHTGASVQAEIEGSGISGRKWLRPGMVWVMPQGSEHAVRFYGKVEGLALSFTRDRLHQLLASAEMTPGQGLAERIVADQPKLEYLMRALWCETLEPTEPGLLTAECIVAALANSLSRPSVDSSGRQEQGWGLTRSQVQKIVSLVKARIAEPLPLQLLADAVGLSPFHFLRAFKRSTGITPHQYVLEQRIETAKGLLRRKQQTVGEVGCMVGFAHQGHFSRAFRRCSGSTPSQFLKSS